MFSTKLFVCCAALVLATGCSEAVVVAGNGASMAIAIALLWSTVNFKGDSA